MEAIEQFDHELTGINSQLKTTPSRLDWDKLPGTRKVPAAGSQPQATGRHREAHRLPARDGVGCDCAEELARTDDAGRLCKICFAPRPTLLPDLEQQKLRVSVHPVSNPRSNRAIAHLLEQLNAAEFTYPGTKLQLVYSIAGEAETPNSVPQRNPTDQEV